jgi:DNA invertase Pin-like site-specific DNA recombinase
VAEEKNSEPQRHHKSDPSSDHAAASAAACVVYVRQSSERQVREHTGSAQFQRNLAAVARSYGWPDSQIQIIEDDLGKSGSSTEGRTGWQRLQEMIEAEEVGAVFGANISRLSRRVIDFELFRLRAACHNTLLYIDGRFINPADSNDTIVSQITAMVAQYENRKRAELMMQGRLAKAKRGEVVSRLPLGWIKRADKRYTYDPNVKDAILKIIETFRRTRSLARTVEALAAAGIRIRYKPRGHGIASRKITTDRVRFILRHPAYAGTYVYGIEKAGGELPATEANRQERCIAIHDHHPAYLSREEQAEFKAILKDDPKRAIKRGRYRSLLQGLVRCVICGESLLVVYRRKAFCFTCRRTLKNTSKPCVNFSSNDLEKAIVREVLNVLKAPPIEMLRAAARASQSQKQARLSRMESERKRLANEERAAQERVDLSSRSLQRVHRAAFEKLENVLQEKERLEQEYASALAGQSDETHIDLEELCRIASDVPELWRDKAVSYEERQQILRSVIDHILIAVTMERIDATIVWRAGGQTPVFVWRVLGRHNLIRELLIQGLTALEIKEHLSAGKTSNGQVLNICLDRIYVQLKQMGLKPAQRPASYFLARKKAAEMHREGRSLGFIAKQLNEQGFASASGRPWTHSMVGYMLRMTGHKPEPIEDLHYRLISQALGRNLSYRQIANEFNRKKIRLLGVRQTWTASSVKRRWTKLNNIEEISRPKTSAAAKESEESTLEKST